MVRSGVVEITVGSSNTQPQLAFSSATYNASLSEDAGPGSHVQQVATTGTQRDVIYEIVSGNENGAFSLSRTQGRLVITEFILFNCHS